jgi:hypothetical protein
MYIDCASEQIMVDSTINNRYFRPGEQIRVTRYRYGGFDAAKIRRLRICLPFNN